MAYKKPWPPCNDPKCFNGYFWFFFFFFFFFFLPFCGCGYVCGSAIQRSTLINQDIVIGPAEQYIMEWPNQTQLTYPQEGNNPFCYILVLQWTNRAKIWNIMSM